MLQYPGERELLVHGQMGGVHVETFIPRNKSREGAKWR